MPRVNPMPTTGFFPGRGRIMRLSGDTSAVFARQANNRDKNHGEALKVPVFTSYS